MKILTHVSTTVTVDVTVPVPVEEDVEIPLSDIFTNREIDALFMAYSYSRHLDDCGWFVCRYCTCGYARGLDCFPYWLR